MDDLNNDSDEELERIISLAQNTHVPGSQYQRAKNTLEVRRSRKLFEQQEKAVQLQARAAQLQESFFEAAKVKLDQIIKILDKPVPAILWAGIGAIIIGIAINLLTDLYHLLPIFRSLK